jgi:hypothetical protein
MIIYGWGRTTTKQYGPAMAMRCDNCNNETWYHFIRRRTWFTLFFIPIIPYSSKHLLVCQVCNAGIEMTGEKIEKARQLSALTQELFDKKIEPAQYQEQTRQLALLA